MFGKRLIFAAACLGIIGGILFAVYVDDAKEPTFMPGFPAWKSEDLPVYVGFAPGVAAYSDQLKDAVGSFNEQAKCEVFTLDQRFPRVTFLTPFDREPCPGYAKPPEPTKDPKASTYFCPDGGIDVVIRDAAEIREAYVVFMHELGHASGLAHDEAGLMKPSMGPADWEPTNVPLPALSRKDRRALRERLCP